LLQLKLRTLIHYLLNDEEKKKKVRKQIRQIKAVDCRSRELKNPRREKQKKTEKINRKTFLKARKIQED